MYSQLTCKCALESMLKGRTILESLSASKYIVHVGSKLVEWRIFSMPVRHFYRALRLTLFILLPFFVSHYSAEVETDLVYSFHVVEICE